MEVPEYPFWIYFWLVRDPITGRIRKTRYRMTEQEAQERHPGAVRVDSGSMEITRPAPSTSDLGKSRAD